MTPFGGPNQLHQLDACSGSGPAAQQSLPVPRTLAGIQQSARVPAHDRARRESRRPCTGQNLRFHRDVVAGVARVPEVSPVGHAAQRRGTSGSPFADATLVKVPGGGHSHDTLKSLVALSDVMCTGHHAAISADVKPGDTVAVVGDGAVGLCAVIAAKRLGAQRIISLSRNPARQALAREFGATDMVAERGDQATTTVMEMTDGIGVDAALECVGTGQSINTAFAIARVGSVVGAIGAPHDVTVPIDTVIFRNIGLRGGVAPVRRYIPELLQDVVSGHINPGRVFDFEIGLDEIVDGYEAMNDRRAIKSLVRVGTI
jgi:threonine dehydrogenase-like Zn-dependent dehydrogenase